MFLSKNNGKRGFLIKVTLLHGQTVQKTLLHGKSEQKYEI